ncbi:hypothetical protein [uncultured Tessaracoccus sp.]|uniref:hypothetical protein n=1 Tax=uncultured Tessaracoccus sp. TaxID=905023 RepID=UPI0025D94CE4|nr:hypothetical protein [uncultured Tessaracoccus sp.]
MDWNLRARLTPPTFGGAVVGTALTGALVLVAALWSMVSHSEALGVSVAVMLLIHGLIILGVAWAAYARKPWAWGMLVAVSLLNACTAASFVPSTDVGQRWLAIVWLVFAVTTTALSILPSTRLALHRE